MNLSGIHLKLLIGPTIAAPAPHLLTEALDSVEVTHSDEGHSGFQITFQVGRSGPLDLMDYPLTKNPLLKPCNRVILIATFNANPRVLMDGVITDQQLSPGTDLGSSTLVVTGEDVSVMMDMEEKSVEHPAQDEAVIAAKIILSYARYGLIPVVIPPETVDKPKPTERIPSQQATDLEYLNEMAARHAYVFYVTPGPASYTNTAYWGPPKRLEIPQRALSVNMGPESNVDTINFRNNALKPEKISGTVQDRETNKISPVRVFTSTRPSLASQPALSTQPFVRHRIFRAEAGLNSIQALGRAQAMSDESTNVVTVDGELDALRYGDLLQARGLVGLRGAGSNYDGNYYVKSVTHVLRKGEYKQRFTLTRDGLGSTTSKVIT